MDDFSRTREEIKTLFDSLSALYKHVQQKHKQVKMTADSCIGKIIQAFVTCDKCDGILNHYLEAYAREE
jgi:3-methyladenine DNA glycosylase AlkD